MNIQKKRQRLRHRPSVSLVAAISSNRIIGFSNKLPWYLPEDLRHFRSKTINKTIVMGRKTFDSIGRALPKRRNIVITRRTDISAPNVEVAGSLQTALSLCSPTSRVFVIGGGEVFREALPIADQINLTVVYLEEHQQSLFGPFLGDKFFPTISPREWRIQKLGPRHRAKTKGSRQLRNSPHGYLNNVFYRFIDLVRFRPWSPTRTTDLEEDFHWSKFRLATPQSAGPAREPGGASEGAS